MADFTIKQDDTLPPLAATLSDVNGPIDLSTATAVIFHMRPVGSTTAKVTHAATIVNAALGQVRYDWQAGDSDTADTYQGEFEVTWSGGVVLTFPNNSYISIDVLDEID